MQWFAGAGAMEALLQAMALLRVVASVQENAVGALRNLADGSEALKQWLAHAGALSPATPTATPTATPPATPTATPTAMVKPSPQGGLCLAV